MRPGRLYGTPGAGGSEAEPTSKDINQEEIMRAMAKVTLLAVVLGLLLAPLAVAGECEGGGCMMGKLGLSPDQLKQVDKLKAAMMEKMLPLKATLRVKRAEMDLLWMSAAPDKKALLAKAAEMDGLRAQMRELKFDFKLAVGKLLNAEQRMKAQMAMSHMGERGDRDDEKGGCDCGKKGGHGGCNCGCDCCKGGHGGKGAGHDCGDSCPMKKGGPGKGPHAP